MANILSLAMKVSADASGVIKNLTPAERALENLGKQAEKTTAVFNKFAKDNEAAAAAQATLNEKFSALAKQLEGGLNAQAYTDQYAALQEEVRQTAAAFEEGIATTRALRTEQKIHSDEMERLNRLVRLGAIDEQTYARGVAQADAALAKATKSADTFADETARAAKEGLKFNEISGILSALPGPLGNIAGRFSGIASASEGLNRVFAGGLNTGIRSLGTQLSSLATPLNLGVAAFAAFGAAATAITRGLVDLAGRVEQLGNTALLLGTDFQTIQVLDESARRSGVAIDALAAGIQNLAVNINEARSGTGKAADAFRELGITQEELLTLDPASLAEKTAAALQKIEDPARRAALATETLGKAALTLLPAFNSIGESETALRRFAALISNVDRDRISSLGQDFDNVKTAILGFGQSILLPFSGVVEGLANLFADIIGVVNRLAQTIGFVLKPVLDAMGRGFAFFGELIRSAFDGFDLFTRGIKVAGDNAKNFRAEVEADTKALEDLQRAIENGNKALNTAIDKAAEFGQEGFKAAFEFQQALRDLADVAKDENYNGEQYARAVANATAEYEKQIATIKRVAEETKKAADEAAKKAEADKKRIEELLNPNDAAAKVQQDIAFVIEQQAEAEKQLAAARAAADQESANSAAARLAQLDGLRTKLEDQSQAIEQGFANGFAEAFTNTAESLDALVNKAGEFGNAGAEAAMKLQEGVAAAQGQVRDGIIPKSVYEAEIAEQRRVFEERIAQLEEVRKKEQAAVAERFQLEVDANQRVNQFISQQSQAEIAAAEQVAARRQQAAFNIEAIEQRIALERQSLEAAREQNDMNAAQAAVQRIDALKEALGVEQQIAAGREQELQKQQQLLTNQQEFQKQQLAAAQQYQQQQQAAQQAYAQEQARIFEEQQKAAAAEAKRQEERLAKLNTLGSQTIGVQDVRTTQGANLVLDLGANAQDPALIQQRLQTKLLERIALGIGQAASNYFNKPVAIVGSAQLG